MVAGVVVKDIFVVSVVVVVVFVVTVVVDLATVGFTTATGPELVVLRLIMKNGHNKYDSPSQKFKISYLC